MDAEDVLRVPGLLDLSALWQIFGECDRDDLKDRPFVPATHPQLADGEVPRSVFNRLRECDILVHHPYHSFSTSVQRFIEQAAADPNERHDPALFDPARTTFIGVASPAAIAA